MLLLISLLFICHIRTNCHKTTQNVTWLEILFFTSPKLAMKFWWKKMSGCGPFAVVTHFFFLSFCKSQPARGRELNSMRKLRYTSPLCGSTLWGLIVNSQRRARDPRVSLDISSVLSVYNLTMPLLLLQRGSEHLVGIVNPIQTSPWWCLIPRRGTLPFIPSVVSQWQPHGGGGLQSLSFLPNTLESIPLLSVWWFKSLKKKLELKILSPFSPRRVVSLIPFRVKGT